MLSFPAFASHLAYGCARHACEIGMGVGLVVDMAASPTHTLLPLCSAGTDLWSQLAEHVVLMPAAHVGMLAGVAFAIFDERRSDVTGWLKSIAFQTLCMVAAEGIALEMMASNTRPAQSMVAMAAIMAALRYTLGRARLLVLIVHVAGVGHRHSALFKRRRLSIDRSCPPFPPRR